eukprot:TRINITY_DN4776_c0_g1_i1.p1 TRINITY_DN4776_c0_g1~~TRINITY_DN4776_c0_g1_i1.p1  ORF type:complete len:1016 (-),score=409.89 TRINITY_DN4776_c0_g1_i1:202-3249(-)
MNETQNKGPLLVWTRRHFLEANSSYSALVTQLVQNLSLVRLVSEAVDAAELDALARIVVRIFNAFGKTLPLLHAMIDAEFELAAAHDSRGSVLRGNNFVSKLEGSYVRTVGAEWVRGLLKGLVEAIAQAPALCLEIDPAKLPMLLLLPRSTTNSCASMQPQPAAELAARRAALAQYAQAVLDRVMDRRMLASLPREIRAICGYTAQAAAVHAPEQSAALIGGFVMLRYVCPALVTPEAWGLLPADEPLPAAARRNLVLITKLVQNASNGVEFSSKEAYMLPMNDFVRRNGPPLASWLAEVATDPRSLTPRSPIDSRSLTDPTPTEPALLPASTTSSATTGAWAEFDAPGWSQHAADIVRQYDLADLFELHRLVHVALPKLIPALLRLKKLHAQQQAPCAADSAEQQRGRSASAHIDLSVEHIDRFISLLQQLGPPPRLSKSRREPASELSAAAATTTSQQQQAASSSRLKRLSLSSPDLAMAADQPPQPSSSADLLVSAAELAMMERARFVYQGPGQAKSGAVVFYLIVQRLSEALLERPAALVRHMLHVLDDAAAAISSRYEVVVDMSWAHLSNRFKKLAYSVILHQLLPRLSRSAKKNVTAVYIVHPTAWTRGVVYLLRAMSSRKMARKLHELYSWKQLSQFIEPHQIALPDTSMRFMPKSYSVVKINHKGRRQQRLIKFTLDSLLNIDPKTRRIQNEKRLASVAQMSSHVHSCELHFAFDVSQLHHAASSDPSSAASDGTLLSPAASGVAALVRQLSGGADSEDRRFRRYECRSVDERDEILADIFKSCYALQPPAIPVGVSTSDGGGGGRQQQPTQAQQQLQEFRVIKVNAAGKHQARVFKLTCDSLLNIDPGSNKIKSEISFAGIDEVGADRDNACVVTLKYKAEAARRKVICANDAQARQLLAALNTSIGRFQLFDETEASEERMSAQALLPAADDMLAAGSAADSRHGHADAAAAAAVMLPMSPAATSSNGTAGTGVTAQAAAAGTGGAVWKRVSLPSFMLPDANDPS